MPDAVPEYHIKSVYVGEDQLRSRPQLERAPLPLFPDVPTIQVHRVVTEEDMIQVSPPPQRSCVFAAGVKFIVRFNANQGGDTWAVSEEHANVFDLRRRRIRSAQRSGSISSEPG